MNRKLLITLFVGMLSCMQVFAQTTNVNSHTANVIKQYQDSLAMLRAKVDSLTNASSVKATHPQLFLPFTYYPGIAQRSLSLDGKLASPDEQTLLNFYLQRPDLVEFTERQLQQMQEVKAVVPAKPAAPTPAPVVSAPVEPEAPVVDVVVKKPNVWNFKADTYMQFLQNYISSNWYKGGESNYSMLASLTVEANYNNKQKVKWDNKLEMKLGFLTSRDDSLHTLKTSEDLFRYTSKLGLQASKHWYYTAQLLAYTQFMRNYKTNNPFVFSDIMSPLTVNLSLGMDYNVDWLNHKLKGTVHLGPAAYNFKYVDRLALSTRNGLEEGKHILHDVGSLFTIDLTWQIQKNIKWKTRMYGFTSYKRVEYEWENTFSFQFNKYISSNIFIYPRFDDSRQRDDHHGYWMFKEYMSIGFNYSF